jgi:hypothetical protein
MMVRIQNLNRWIADKVTRRYDALFRHVESNDPGTILVEFKTDTFQIEDDFGHIFLHTGNSRKFMDNTIDPDRNDCRALDGRQQNPSERVTERNAEPPLQRLTNELSVKTRMGRLINLDSLRSYHTAPISLHNDHSLPFGS